MHGPPRRDHSVGKPPHTVNIASNNTSTMTTRVLITLFVAFCACASLHASPLLNPPLLDAEVNDLDLEPQLRLPNATEILEQIERLLGAVEERIAEVSDSVQRAVEQTLSAVEDAALQAASKWNSTVQEWADKASAAGVDIQECLEEQKSLAAVVDELRADARACVDKRLQEVLAALRRLLLQGPKAQAVLAEAKEEVKRCAEQDSGVATAICLATVVPRLQIKAAGVVANTVYLAGVVTAKVLAVGPLATLCASAATASSAAEASKIVDQTVSCIREKLE